MQAMYMYLCCYAIWDVGGVWSWLVVAQRKTIQAVARYDATGQVSHVLTISRQGFHHTYMSLVANSASQMQLQAPVNTTPALDLPTSKKVLDLARAVMGAGFDDNDSLCKYARHLLLFWSYARVNRVSQDVNLHVYQYQQHLHATALNV